VHKAYLLFEVSSPSILTGKKAHLKMSLTVEGSELVKDQKYQVRIMTRDPKSRRAKELATLPGVELFQGTFAREDDLTKGFTGCDGAVGLPLLSCCSKFTFSLV
jgi:hypothetical protein